MRYLVKLGEGVAPCRVCYCRLPFSQCLDRGHFAKRKKERQGRHQGPLFTQRGWRRQNSETMETTCWHLIARCQGWATVMNIRVSVAAEGMVCRKLWRWVTEHNFLWATRMGSCKGLRLFQQKKSRIGYWEAEDSLPNNKPKSLSQFLNWVSIRHKTHCLKMCCSVGKGSFNSGSYTQ